MRWPLLRRLSLVLLLLLAGLGAYAFDLLWEGFRQEIVVADVTRPQTLALHKQRRGFVYALEYEVDGQIDGTAELLLVPDGSGNPYETMPLSGTIAGQRRGDWYADTAVVVYRPRSVRGGHLQMTYRFRSLR